MKRFIFSIVLQLVCISLFAQAKIGLQISPTISSNRVETQSETYDVSNDGSSLKLRLGVVVDLPLADNYYFSTGLLYTPKEVGLKGVDLETNTTYSESYNFQYLQIPLTMKLFTNEITLDTRLFFNLGANAEIAISEKFDKENVIIEDFKFFDASLVLGAGIERKIGTNTAVYGALMYNRGLINPISQSLDIGEDLILKNDLISLDIGIKF